MCTFKVVIIFPTIELKKVDSKGRVILPRKDLHEIFITELGDLIIASKTKNELENAIKSIEDHNKQRKLVALKEWENLLQEAEVIDISTADIDKATLNVQKKKINFIIDDKDVKES